MSQIVNSAFRKSSDLSLQKLLKVFDISLDDENFKNLKENDPSMLKMSDFIVIRKTGGGSFSKVFIAKHKETGNLYALKIIKDKINLIWIKKEIEAYFKVDHPHVNRLIDFFSYHNRIVYVLELVPHLKFRCLMRILKGIRLKHYMYQLLSALEHLHSRRIIHHDVKPSNFLFDPHSNIGSLVDLGLCEDDLSVDIVEPISDYFSLGIEKKWCHQLRYPHTYKRAAKALGNTNGTPGFKAPEVLLFSINQSTAVDIWAVGVILLIILSQRYPFFIQKDDLLSLYEIAHIVGSEAVLLAAVNHTRALRMDESIPPMNLKTLIQGLNPKIKGQVDDSVYDLLKRMLDPNSYTRITAKEALAHPFFNGYEAKKKEEDPSYYFIDIDKSVDIE